ncbi:MAG: type 3 dihydrofolate reductase [Gammaproteobacteria bacterium]|jgi:dihydrofolate reductase|nr:type 3 dihydrofolate reductase [Gammaproteobacteria bacterium]
MTISIIVAASENNVIGAAGDLPWRLSDDLRRFKTITMGKPIVMGRKTWDSIGRPLPGRQNIVVTRQAEFAAAGCDVVASKEEAITVAGSAEEVMVIGGSQVYELFLPDTKRLYLTRVHADVEGDALFPEFSSLEWRLVSDESCPADDRNAFDYSFQVYERA